MKIGDMIGYYQFLLFLVEFLGEKYCDGFLYDCEKHVLNKK